MGKFKTIVGFLKNLFAFSYLKIGLLLIFGFLNSLLQGISIVMIIPLIEGYHSGNFASNFIGDFLVEIGLDNSLKGILILYASILIGYAFFKASYTYLSQMVIATFSNQYSINALKSVINANWDFYLKYSPSKLTNLFNQEARSVLMLSFQSFRLIQTSLLVFVQLGLAFLISPSLTTITLGVLVVLYFLLQFFFKRGFQIGDKRVKINEQIQRILTENFQGIKFIKLHNLERKSYLEYGKGINGQLTNELKKAKLDGISELLYITAGALVVVIIIYIGLSNQMISIGSLLVLLVLLSRSINQFQSLTKILSAIFNQLPSYYEFTKILKGTKSSKSREDVLESVATINKIELKNIQFSYGENTVLHDFNLTFEKGNSYLFYGRSGRGKTTALDIISGLLKSQHGTILVDGSPLSKSHTNTFSYVLQDTFLFEGTILENITLDKSYSEEIVNDVVQKVELEKLISDVPEGLNYIIKEGGKGLSGGEKQRIAIARALILNSNVILLDEFTSALDTATETSILKALNQLKKDRIIITVAHRERLKDWADEVIIFE